MVDSIHMRLERWFGLASALVFLASSALAQPAPTPEEVQQAQVRWNEGKAFFDSGNFEAARVAFKQAYTVFPHPVFLQNLGEAELRTGRNVEAARHFEAFLRASSSASSAQRDLAKKSLRRAAETLGSMVIEANADDAEIRVDDEVVGRTPLGSLEWYVEPGRHVVVARKEGYLDGSEQVFVPAGAAKTVVVRVQRVAGGADASSAVPGAPGAEASAGPPKRAERTPLSPRTLVVAGGAVLTLAALTVGTVYAVRVGSDASHVESARARLPEPERGCVGDAAPPGVCDELARYRTRLPVDQNARNVAFGVAGVLGAATIVTFLVWPRRSPDAVVVSGMVESGQYGFALSGRF